MRFAFVRILLVVFSVQKLNTRVWRGVGVAGWGWDGWWGGEGGSTGTFHSIRAFHLVRGLFASPLFLFVVDVVVVFISLSLPPLSPSLSLSVSPSLTPLSLLPRSLSSPLSLAPPPPLSPSQLFPVLECGCKKLITAGDSPHTTTLRIRTF